MPQKGNILLVIVSLVALLSLSAAGYLFWKNQQLITGAKFNNNSLNTITTIKPYDDATEWKTHSNPLFSIKLPAQMNDFLCDEASCWSKSTKLPTGGRLTFITGGPNTYFSTKSINQILDDLQKSNVFYTQTKNGDVITIKVSESKGVVPLATAALEQHANGVLFNKGTSWVSLFVTKTVSCETICQELAPTTEDKKLFDQILSTFKFANAQPNTSAKTLTYHFPAGWKTVRNFANSLEIGYDPSLGAPVNTNASEDLTLSYNQCCGGSYGISVRPYNNGSRHQFIYDQLGIKQLPTNLTSTYHEQEYSYNGWNCLVLYGLPFSASGMIWGMCPTSPTKAIFIIGPSDQYATEAMISTIKVLK